MFIEVMIFLLEWGFLGWVFFTLFLWLFSCILKAVSAFPTYCFLHNLHTIKYITNMMQKINFVKNVICFLSLLTLKSWCCCDLVAAQSSAISKIRETFPWFQSAFVYFLYNVIFDFVAPDVILEIFIEFESCNWFVLKSIFWGIC